MQPLQSRWWELSCGLLAVGLLLRAFIEPVAAQEMIFSAGGTFEAPAGYVGIPTSAWNPESNAAHPSNLPFRVPEGKSLLITDIYLETDPLPPYPFLMALAVEDDEKPWTLRTIHLREPQAAFHSFRTPIPIMAGTSLNVLFQSSMPASQSVNWSVTGRLVDEIDVIETNGTPGKAPKGAIPYPFPRIYLANDRRPMSVSASSADNPQVILADIGTADFVANPKNGQLARVLERSLNRLSLDRPFPLDGEVVPVWVADYGTKTGYIRDPQAPDCADIRSVLLLGTFVGEFEVTACQPGAITVNTVAPLAPGQKLQYLGKTDP